MTADPRAALSALVTAFERHLETAAARRGEDDPAVAAAYDQLADAFLDYDEALVEAYGEATPLDVFDLDDEDDDETDDDVFDEDDADEDDENEDDEDDEDDADDDPGDEPAAGFTPLDDDEYDVDPRG